MMNVQIVISYYKNYLSFSNNYQILKLSITKLKPQIYEKNL